AESLACSNIRIQGGRFRHPNQYGIVLGVGENAVTGFEVSNALIEGLGGEDSGNLSIGGLLVQNGAEGIVVGNKITKCRFSGIVEQNPSTDNLFIANRLLDNGSASHPPGQRHGRLSPDDRRLESGQRRRQPNQFRADAGRRALSRCTGRFAHRRRRYQHRAALDWYAHRHSVLEFRNHWGGREHDGACRVAGRIRTVETGCNARGRGNYVRPGR
ncbi:MAG TPA: right-handed parallel beta-helix repeat-containing protein, partial [Verrucomicrobiota bacterium]|nr:right-handed parallel beta-helix repeat-containing protein [Verrucomicrobiota bacterium]